MDSSKDIRMEQSTPEQEPNGQGGLKILILKIDNYILQYRYSDAC